MSLLRNASSLHDKIKTLNTLKDKLKNLETPEKIRGTFLERWGKYWKGLYADYKDVAVDVAKECRDRPLKATLYFTALTSGYFFFKNNPDECTFREDLLRSEMKLMQIGESTRNPVSVEHISQMCRSQNNNLLKRLSLGIVSFMWVDNASDLCANYKYTCSYLKPRYVNFHERIVDIGFMNKWWILENKMKDYDVNVSEYR